jgi:hypothetical protein
VSIFRIQALFYFANSPNPTWDQWSIAWWSTIEINIGFVCTCLPTLRLILMRVYPGISSAPSQGSYSSQRLNGNGRGCGTTTRCSHVVQQHVSTSTVEIPMTDDLSKHASGKYWLEAGERRNSQIEIK